MTKRSVPCQITSMGRGKSATLRPISPICLHSRARRIPPRTVLAANVFPTCGVDAVFSNAINHSIVVRRAKVAGLGDATKFETIRPGTSLQLADSTRSNGARRQKPVQRGTCILPDGQTLRFVANDENGSSTPDGTFRVFRRFAVRSLHPCVAISTDAVMRSPKPALARQRALHCRRVRYRACAHSGARARCSG